MTDGPTATTHRIRPELAGTRLDRAVADLEQISRSRAARLVDDGLVTVDDRRVARSHAVSAGEQVVVTQPAVPEPTPPPDLPPVLVDDPDLWVLDKPAGMVVHPGHGHPDGTLADALAASGVTAGPDPGRPGIVHRLDKDTSGVLVVARTDAAHAALVEAMAARTVTRLYLALVEGSPPGPHGVVDVPLGRDEHDRTRFAPRVDGRHAVTHFRVVASGAAGDPTRPVHLVACRLETGRTHQIRVHLAHMGCPVVGDVTYGASADLAADLGVERTLLHATRVALRHPLTGATVTATAPLPADFATAAAAVGIEADAAAHVRAVDPGA